MVKENIQQSSFGFTGIAATDSSAPHVSSLGNGDNSLKQADRAFHDWYRFVLSYPPHLVRRYLEDFGLTEDATVLDPFCGTGTTIVESKINRIKAVGLDANPFPQFASSVKSDWDIDPELLLTVSREVTENTNAALLRHGIYDRSLTVNPDTELRTLSEHAARAIIKNSISPVPLHKTLVLLNEINKFSDSQAHKYLVLALGNALVTEIGNLRFGPEVGVGKIKQDVPVIPVWTHGVRRMVNDLRSVYGASYPPSTVYLADARRMGEVLSPRSVDAVITSPPYPNEKDYTRTTRLESVVLGFYADMSHIRRYKKTLLRSNTRGVYKVDDDDKWVEDYPEIQRLADEIENRRLDMGKTSGFEKLYARVTKLYFGGMARHFVELSKVLKPGAMLAYVVGDQASYLQVMIRTGQILADIAQRHGYEVERIDLFRTRFATATQTELREEVIVLRWPG